MLATKSRYHEFDHHIFSRSSQPNWLFQPFKNPLKAKTDSNYTIPYWFDHLLRDWNSQIHEISIFKQLPNLLAFSTAISVRLVYYSLNCFFKQMNFFHFKIMDEMTRKSPFIFIVIIERKNSKWFVGRGFCRFYWYQC